MFITPQPILDEIALETSNQITEGQPVGEINNRASSIKIAKIDATKNKITSGQFSVTSFPTIKYVNNGILGEYTGIRTKESFLSFINIMRGDHLIKINSLDDLRTLQLSNLLSDTSNSNIVFLLTIYRKKENIGSSLEGNQNSSNNVKNKKEIEIEKIFGEIAKSHQGKAVFTILYENEYVTDVEEMSKDERNYNIENEEAISGFYSISKREIHRRPIYFSKKNIIDKMHNLNINNENNLNKNNDVNDSIMLSQSLESFIDTHNRHLISRLSQYNFRELMSLKKIMIIAVVQNISTQLINNNNDNNFITKNENNNGEIVDSVIIDSENILNLFEKNILNKFYNLDNFNKNSDEDENNNFTMNNSTNNFSNLHLNDCIFGFLDSKRWIRFLKQYGVKSSSILILDFRTPNLYYYQKSLKKYLNSGNKNKNKNSTIQENQENRSILDININLILDDLFSNKLKFKKLKSSRDILFEIAFLIKSKFVTLHPLSIFFCFIVIILFCSSFTLSPSIRRKKD